jgi:hypothetical protein
MRALARGAAPLVGDRRVAEQRLLAILDARSAPADSVKTRPGSAIRAA